jgi:hypothetical protein
MKRYRHGGFAIFSGLYFLLALGFLGVTQWDCGAGASVEQCRSARPDPWIVLALALGLYLLIGWALFRPGNVSAEQIDPGGSRWAEPEEWAQSDEGKLVVARLDAWGAAMTPLMVLLHVRSSRRGESFVSQVGMTPEEARAVAAALVRMADRVEAEAPRTVQ